MDYAAMLGGVIKLIGATHKEGDKIYTYVSPVMFNKEHPLAGVSDVFNAIFVKGNMLGDAMFYGQGAGKDATASAVVSDIIDEARNLNSNLGYTWDETKLNLADVDTMASSYFVRVKGDVKDAVKSAFAGVKLIDSVVDGETAFLTGEITGSELKSKTASFDVINIVKTEL
jgi:homoserine dehydrogenase